jgi:hypothetical protein
MSHTAQFGAERIEHAHAPAPVDTNPPERSAGAIHCPRCGYDQHGEIRTWVNHCPMHGTCTECGLDLEWSRVFTLARHPWLFEYHWRDRPIRRLRLTITYALMPRRFWREVRLEDPIHLRPVWLIAAILLMTFLLGYVVTVLAVVHRMQGPFVQRWTNSTSEYWMHVFRIAIHDSIMALPTALAAPVLTLLIMPLTFLLIPTTLRRSRVRFGHVCRIALYGLVLPVVVAITWCIAQFAFHAAPLEDVGALINPWQWRFWHALSPDLALHDFVIAAGLAVLLAAWLAYWWYAATARYLRLKTPLRVVGVMMFVSLLAGVTVHLWLSLLY